MCCMRPRACRIRNRGDRSSGDLPSLPQSAEFSAPNSVPQFGHFCGAPCQNPGAKSSLLPATDAPLPLIGESPFASLLLCKRTHLKRAAITAQLLPRMQPRRTLQRPGVCSVLINFSRSATEHCRSGLEVRNLGQSSTAGFLEANCMKRQQGVRFVRYRFGNPVKLKEPGCSSWLQSFDSSKRARQKQRLRAPNEDEQ